MVELCLRLELLEGHSEATRIAVDPGLPKWTAQHYLVIPGAVYDANRLPCRTFRYPPFLADEDILGVQTQSVVGDILWGSGATGTMPRLAIGTASSALSLRSNDCAMPAVGVYDPVQQFGHWWFIEHRTRLGNSGIAVEESDDRSRAHLRFSFPGKRCYGMPAEAEQMPDWKAGDKLESRWLGWAEEAAALCATWMTWYDYPFPAKSVFGRTEMHSYGAVWANAQNKHGAPNICTLSGVGLLKLFRGTGRRDYLDMLRAVTHHQTQYVARDDRPIDPGLRSGWMQEKVNLSDWGPGSGGIDHSSTWPETALLSSYVEVPGIYLQFDTGVIAVLDHVKVEWDGNGGIIIENPTRYDAVYRVLADDEASLRRPLGWSPSSRYVDIPVAAKERRAVTLQAWLA